jgi:endogenous inhibitor of DNA gyrase (YacG/DUF329 family)
MICPTCGKPTHWKDNPSRPFCSERCKLIDFGRWADEDYRLPAEPAPLDELADTEQSDRNSRHEQEN